MKIIVTGGRNYDNVQRLANVLDALSPSLVIQGGASGADYWAREWAKFNKVECITYEALWGKEGKAAGPLRNKRMIEENPDAIVIAFAGGRGTENCYDQAFQDGLIVLRVYGD